MSLNVNGHINDVIEQHIGTIEFPVSTSLAMLMLQTAGYRVNTLILDKLAKVIGYPPGNSGNLEWLKEDVQRYAVELHRHRAWLFYHTTFDEERDETELLQAKTERKELAGILGWCRRESIGAIGVLLAEETRYPFRIAILHEFLARHVVTVDTTSGSEF